jgi:hypothetical protein
MRQLGILNSGKFCTLDWDVLAPTHTLGNGQPMPDLVEKILDFDTLMAGNVRFELGKSFGKLAARAFAVPVFEVIEADGNLYQSLQEKPISLSVLVPEVFPDVMGFKKAPLVKVPYALMKSLVHHEATYETLP